MANIAAHVIAQHGAANHAAAAPGIAKNAGGLEDLFAALLSAGKNAGAGTEAAAGAAVPSRAENAATRLAGLLNGSAQIAMKTAASKKDAAKPGDAADTRSDTAKTKPAAETKNGNKAAEALAELAALPAQLMATPSVTGIKKTAQPQETGAKPIPAAAQAALHAAAQSAVARAGETAVNDTEKTASADAKAAGNAVAQDTEKKSQTAAEAGKTEGLKAALAALQTHVDKAAHQNIPAEKTGQALPPPTAAIAAKTDGQGENSASSNTGRHDSHTQDRHEGATDAPAKAMPAPAETAAAAPSANGNAGAPASNPDTAPQTAASVSATLTVGPQSGAHSTVQSGADNQAVPLSNLGALAVSIAAKSLSGAKQFDIDLHPAELGSIHVRLSVEHSGLAQAHLTADNSQTLALLQRDSHTLERALKDAGLNLAGSGLNFSLKGQERETGNGPRPNMRGRSLSVGAIASPAPAGLASTDSLAPDSVRLDIRV